MRLEAFYLNKHRFKDQNTYCLEIWFITSKKTFWFSSRGHCAVSVVNSSLDKWSRFYFNFYYYYFFL